ncbi:hypothetical protein V6N12_007167 [Hibiscus sabdariffa]|uniref:Uncharacterized protein n=1 Tax=Hibiscus sabdariffa TaxID=183260 RepID=A0ABR2F0Y2_9ROSI
MGTKSKETYASMIAKGTGTMRGSAVGGKSKDEVVVLEEDYVIDRSEPYPSGFRFTALSNLGGGDESPTEEVLAIGTPVLVVHPVGNDPDLVPKENVQTTVVLKSTAYMESKPNKKKKATTISVVPLVNNQEPEVVTWNSAQGAGQHMEVSIVEKYDRSKPPVGVKIIKARGHRTRCVEDGSR